MMNAAQIIELNAQLETFRASYGETLQAIGILQAEVRRLRADIAAIDVALQRRFETANQTAEAFNRTLQQVNRLADAVKEREDPADDWKRGLDSDGLHDG